MDSTDLLGVEYLRFIALLQDHKDWVEPNPLHPRGAGGRFVDVPDFLQNLGDMPSGEPGAGEVRRAVSQPPSAFLAIREPLARRRTRAAIQSYLREGLSRITGRDVQVDLGDRMHLTTQRELAEGFLRVAELWPDTNLSRVSVAQRLDGPAPDSWATTRRYSSDGFEIVLNERQLGNRQRFLERLRRTIEAGDHRPTADNAAYIAAHSMGHIQIDQLSSTQSRAVAVEVLDRMRAEGVNVDNSSDLASHIASQLGRQSLNSQREMGAEAFADAVLNDDPAPVSLAIVSAARFQLTRGQTPDPAAEPSMPDSPRPPGSQPRRRRASVGLRISQALQAWSNGRGSDQPLDEFEREPLRQVAREYGISLRRGAAVEEIRAALLDHTRRTVRDRPDPATTGADGQLRSLADMIANPATIRDEQIKAIFEGEFGGLHSRVRAYYVHGRQLTVEGTVHDNHGRQVGRTEQDYYREGGKLIAHHGLMELNNRVQGSGFATAFGGHLLTWYKDSGVAELHTFADIDVGGYTWARGGFQFADTSSARGVLNRLDRIVDQVESWRGTLAGSEMLRGAPDVDEQIRLGRELLARARSPIPFRDPAFPTAHEISQLGRWDGAGKDDMWIGKVAMLGSHWNAVLPL